MIADFYNSFEEEKDDNLDIPEEILEVLNQELPDNFSYYKDLETGKYMAGPRPECFLQEMVLSVEIEEDALDRLKDIPKDKWPEYIYRTQMVVPIKNAHIGNIDKQIPVESMYGNPFNSDIKLTDMKMYPKPFPKPFAVDFESPEGEKIEIHF